jgi:hypothetical protein
VTTLGAAAATMRAAVMYAVDDIRIEERPLPQLEAGRRRWCAWLRAACAAAT